MVAPIPAVPTGLWYCFWLTILLGKGSSRGYLALPTKIVLSASYRELVQEICQLPNMSSLNIHLGPGEITSAWVYRTRWALCVMDLDINLIYYLITQSPQSIRGPPRISINSDQCLIILQSLGMSLPSVHAHSINSHRSFGERLGEIFMVYSCDNVTVSFLKRAQFLLQSLGPGYVP